MPPPVSKDCNTETGFPFDWVVTASFVHGPAWEAFRATLDGVDMEPPSGGRGAAEQIFSAQSEDGAQRKQGIPVPAQGCSQTGGAAAGGDITFGAKLERCSAGNEISGTCPPIGHYPGRTGS